MTNTLAYYGTELMVVVKSFIANASGWYSKQHSFLILTLLHNASFTLGIKKNDASVITK